MEIRDTCNFLGDSSNNRDNLSMENTKEQIIHSTRMFESKLYLPPGNFAHANNLDLWTVIWLLEHDSSSCLYSQQCPRTVHSVDQYRVWNNTCERRTHRDGSLCCRLHLHDRWPLRKPKRRIGRFIRHLRDLSRLCNIWGLLLHDERQECQIHANMLPLARHEHPQLHSMLTPSNDCIGRVD